VNPVVEKNLVEIFREFDFDKRKELMKQVLQEYTREVPVIPLYNRTEIAVVPANLKGYRMTGHQFYGTMTVNDWTLE